jgi:hypothetical protein
MLVAMCTSLVCIVSKAHCSVVPVVFVDCTQPAATCGRDVMRGSVRGPNLAIPLVTYTLLPLIYETTLHCTAYELLYMCLSSASCSWSDV